VRVYLYKSLYLLLNCPKAEPGAWGRLSRLFSPIMYPGPSLGYAIRKFVYTVRKKFFWALFCMGNRIDMRNAIQPNDLISESSTYLQNSRELGAPHQNQNLVPSISLVLVEAYLYRLFLEPISIVSL